MTLPFDHPLVLYRGDTQRWGYQFWDDAGRTQPHDLTDVVVAAEIRRASGAPPVTLPCTVSGNAVTLTLSAEAARALPASAQWDLEFRYLSGDVRTMVAGTVDVRGDITVTP